MKVDPTLLIHDILPPLLDGEIIFSSRSNLLYLDQYIYIYIYIISKAFREFQSLLTLKVDRYLNLIIKSHRSKLYYKIKLLLPPFKLVV